MNFGDVSGIEVVNGGVQTISIGQFNGWAKDNRFGWGACRVDENGTVRQITIDEMHAGFAGATETDTVYLSESVTLASDVTVNAVLLANNVTLDLGGHTLTLKSGVIRPQGKFGYYVKNGTVATEKPLTTSDAVNNADVRFSAALAYAGTGEGVVAFNSWGGSHPGIEQFTNYTGKH